MKSGIFEHLKQKSKILLPVNLYNHNAKISLYLQYCFDLLYVRQSSLQNQLLTNTLICISIKLLVTNKNTTVRGIIRGKRDYGCPDWDI